MVQVRGFASGSQGSMVVTLCAAPVIGELVVGMPYSGALASYEITWVGESVAYGRMVGAAWSVYGEEEE